MTVLIGSWEFEGPFSGSDELRDEPGLVAILVGAHNEYELLEMEESDSVKKFVDAYDKFQVDGVTDVAVVVYYCSDLTSSLRAGLIDEVMKELEEGDWSELPHSAIEYGAAEAVAS
jgi:hypothetical protein